MAHTLALRERGREQEESYDLRAVTQEVEGDGGVAHGEYLLKLAEAVVLREAPQVKSLWPDGVELLGASGPVSAVTQAAMFDGINRVADGIGIPLDESMSERSEDLLADTRIADMAK